jgi:predicted NBD/HSP70 family sugar kinase
LKDQEKTRSSKLQERLTTEDRILRFAKFSAGTDRVELARELALPMPTVVSAARRLVSAGSLVETATARALPGAGRPPRVLRPAGPPPLLGLIRWDQGLRALCYDFAGNRLGESTLHAPGSEMSEAGLYSAVEQVLALAAGHPNYDLAVVVLSVPAPFLQGRGAPTGHVALPETQTSFLVTVTDDIEDALTRRYGVPVIMENDANLAALGEQYAGAGVGVDNFVYVKINEDGFGSAIVLNGALARGAHGYAGELAHIQMDTEGPLCACGGRGCLRSQVRNLVVHAAQAAYDEKITFADLARLAQANDAGAARMLRDIGRQLGRPLAHLCTFVDPALVIIDSEIGPSVAHIASGITDVFTVQAPPVIANNVALVTSELGLAAEVHGALEVPRQLARRGYQSR